MVAAGAEYEEDPIDLDPSQPDAGAAAGVHANAGHDQATNVLNYLVRPADGTGRVLELASGQLLIDNLIAHVHACSLLSQYMLTVC